LLPFFYTLFVTLLYIVALPFLLLLSFKQKYHDSIPARFFLFKNKPFEKKQSVWFHACSLGEVNSLKSIIECLEEKSINLSVITQTGFKAAQSIKSVHVRYLPYELFLPFWIKRQRVLVVTEAELWPFLFVFAKAKGTKTILVNARISDNSYKSYKKFAFFYRWIFLHVDKIFAQSEVDKTRLLELGAKEVEVIGNIKTITTPKITKEYKKPNKEVITLASSHEGEEELLLESLHVKKNQMLVVVPRHPERFEKVDVLLREFAKQNNLTYSKLSENESFENDVVLCDKMGELVNIYAISDITYLCGAFKEGIGGHNPLEPAFFGNKIISGKHYFNQKPLFALVKNIAIVKTEEIKSLNYDVIEKSEILYKGDIEPLLKEIKK
jgi:3-deoxy-D-manno-octulosonic-acid transferase